VATQKTGPAGDAAGDVRDAAVEVADLVAGLGGDVGSVQAAGSRHVGQLAARHTQLAEAAGRLTAAVAAMEHEAAAGT
jgi:hypothetical protein